MKIEEAIQAIQSGAVKCVSFDVFDTLIVRPEFESRDLFHIIERSHDRTLGRRNKFSSLRKNSEKVARKKLYARHPEYQEIRLDDIYDFMVDDFLFDRAEVEAWKQHEIDTEIRFSSARKRIKELFDLALFNGLKVVIISDMYLPESVIREMLEKAGFSGYYALYVSSTYRVSKHVGDLFDDVLADLLRDSVIQDPSDILHIGDNEHSDVHQARSRGLRTCWTPSPKYLFRNLAFLGDVYTKQAVKLPPQYRLLIGNAMNHYFDHPTMGSMEKQLNLQGDAKRVGYWVGGPLLLNLCLWLLEEAKRNGYRKIFFLARDGYVPIEVCRKLSTVLGHTVELEYLPVSRQALYATNFNTHSDILNLDEQHPIKPEMSYRQILDVRFSFVREGILEAALLENGIQDLDQPVRNKSELVQVLASQSQEILADAQKQQDLLREYYEGLRSDQSAALFDLGYHGSTQRALSYLCGRTLDCFYVYGFGTMMDLVQDGARVFSYMAPLESSHVAKTKVSPVIEPLLCAEGPSLIAIEEGDEGVELKYEDIPGWGLEGTLQVALIHEGIFEFVDATIACFGEDSALLYCDPASSLMNFELFQKFADLKDVSTYLPIVYENLITGEMRLLSDRRYWSGSRVLPKSYRRSNTQPNELVEIRAQSKQKKPASSETKSNAGQVRPPFVVRAVRRVIFEPGSIMRRAKRELKNMIG